MTYGNIIKKITLIIMTMHSIAIKMKSHVEDVLKLVLHFRS